MGGERTPAFPPGDPHPFVPRPSGASSGSAPVPPGLAPIRLLIVDDNALVRQGLTELFLLVPGVQVVGVAVDGAEAVTQADLLSPDIVLMDLSMPRMNGIEATRSILAANPARRVVILTAHGEPSLTRGALLAGASGVVFKDSDAGDLIRAVLAVHPDASKP